MSFMGKLDKKVVVELLSEEANRGGLQCNGHFGNRNGQSAIEAVAIIFN
jgi:hypothetical protein